MHLESANKVKAHGELLSYIPFRPQVSQWAVAVLVLRRYWSPIMILMQLLHGIPKVLIGTTYHTRLSITD
jgi:hypothetical protein